MHTPTKFHAIGTKMRELLHIFKNQEFSPGEVPRAGRVMKIYM